MFELKDVIQIGVLVATVVGAYYKQSGKIRELTKAVAGLPSRVKADMILQFSERLEKIEERIAKVEGDIKSLDSRVNAQGATIGAKIAHEPEKVPRFPGDKR